MTKEELEETEKLKELFKKNFPEYVTEKGMCLSPYWDLFSAGLEAGETKWYKPEETILTMFYIYSLTGETPSKKNSRINTRSGKSFPNQRYAKWEAEAVAQLMSQDRPAEPIDVPIKLTVNFYHGDNVRRDSDNQLSSILDALQKAAVLSDDRWQIVQDIRVHNFKADKSWCEIAIRAI